MPIDANIILGLKPPQIDSPLNALAQIAQLQAHQQQAQLGALQLQQGRQAMEQDAATREAVKGFGADPEANAAALLKAGDLKGHDAYRKTIADAAEKRTLAQKQFADAQKSALEAKRSILPMAQGPDDAARWVQSMYSDPLTKDVAASFGTPEQMVANIPRDPAQFQEWLKKNTMGMDKYIQDQTTQQGHLLTAQTAAAGQAGSDRRAMWTAGATIGAQGIDPRSILSSLGAPVPGSPMGSPAQQTNPLAGQTAPLAGQPPNQLVRPSAPSGPTVIPPQVQSARDVDAGKLMIANEYGGDVGRAKADLVAMLDGIAKAPKGAASNDAVAMLKGQAARLQAGINAMGGGAPQPAAAQADGPKLLPGMMPLVDRIGRGDTTFEKGTEGMHPLVKGLVQTELESRYPQPDMSLTGEAFLKTLPPGQAAQVKMMAEGKIPVTAQTQRSPEGARLLQMAAQYEPGTDATIYQSRFATAKDAASGKLATSNNALNTVAGHLAGLAQSAEALNNTSFPWVNKVKNLVETATGDPRVNTFNTNLNGVVDELERAYRGAGGSEGSIQLWRKNLGDASSPEQFREVLKKAAEMVQSKLEANQAQYEQGMHGKPGDHRSITPAAEAAFARLMGRSASTTQSGLQGAIEAELARRKGGK